MRAGATATAECRGALTPSGALRATYGAESDGSLGAGERGDEGFMLLAALVMVFLMLLALSVAAPRIGRAIQRDKEQESAHRAEQYVRAVRIFYLKFKRYPTSIEQLEKTNNQRFLRQRYVDPLTGKSDWRLIHQGENQTQVKGFFGDDLPGLPTGLGSAAGLQSSTGTGSNGGSAFNNSTPGAGGGLGGGLGGTSAAGGAGSAFGGSSGTGAGATGTTSGTGTGSGSGTGSSSGVASQDATSFTGSGGGPIIGVGSAKTGEAMLVVNEQTTYETWEFLYDPRIEQLYAKANLLGGIASGSGTSGFGSTPVGTPVGTPIGGSPTTPAGGTPTTPAVPGGGTPQ